MMISETERLRVATWTFEDWRGFAPIAGDPRVVRLIGDGQTWDEQRVQAWVKKQIALQERQGFCRYKLELRESGEVVGLCGLDYFGNTGEVEIGWWLAADLWGQGLASEAAHAVYAYARSSLGLARLISVCHEANDASRRIMEKLGLHFERKTTTDAMGLEISVPVYVYASCDRPRLAHMELPIADARERIVVGWNAGQDG